MNIIAVMMAAGDKSTLKRKNSYPILGKPMLQWSLEEAKKAKFIDHVFCWTEDEELKQITRDCGCNVIPRMKEQVHYHGGFSNPRQWGPARTRHIESVLGQIDIQIDLNCNYCLFTGELLSDMYSKLMEDALAKDIFPVTRFNGHLFQINPKNDKLFPVWHCQDFDRQKYPDLVLRGSGISITHMKRQREMVSLQSLYHYVDHQYLLYVHDKDDVELAEYYLSKRQTQWEPRLHELAVKPGSILR